MQRLAAITVFFTALVGILLSPTLAQASGGGDETPTKFSWKDSGATRAADLFVQAVANGDYTAAYEMGGEVLREKRTLEEFTADMQRWGFDKPGSVEWDNGNNALPANNGFKLMGTYSPQSGDAFPVYLHLEGDAHVGPYERDRSWSAATKWTVMDYRSGKSMFSRLAKGDGGTPLDWFLLVCALGLSLAFICLVVYYIYGLRGHPRELWLMYFTKLTEYSAYGAAASIMVLFLQNDVLFNGQPLGDSPGYLYYMVWGLVATIITMMVGAVCDTIGVKKCLLIGAVMLLISRFFMPLSQDIFFVSIMGFLPLAFGFAITGPVLKVGIKWFTTLKTATLGFGLFYTLMNVGFWFGAELADYFRKNHSDGIEIWGLELTTYQAIIFVGFFINIPDFIAILLMRDGAEMTEKGLVIRKSVGDDQETISKKLRESVAERRTQMWKEFKISMLWTLGVGVAAYIMVGANVHKWSIGVIKTGSYMWALVITTGLCAVGGLIYAGFSHAGTAGPGGSLDRVMKSVRDATQGTIVQLKENFQQRPFWIYMAMLGILVFVRLTFYVFHVMFPTYAIRVFGDDFPVASIFGSLNPAMIIFLVPLISVLTVKVRSYTMLILGTTISAASVFLCFIPERVAIAIGDTWLGTWIFDYWLDAPIGNQDPFLVSLVVFIIVFTVGEAIWSPRLMQFSAEIAPRGKEGAYISLAILPYFLGKIGATVMADMLTTEYFQRGAVEYPNHQQAWFWIGSMALISPIGMIVWRKTFNQSEKMAESEAKAQVAAEEAEAASEEQGA
jgi:MFS family permease